MIGNLGNLAIYTGFALCIYAIFALIVGLRFDRLGLILSARRSVLLTFGCTVVAYLALSAAFLGDDFSRMFVFKNSSTDLPFFYKLTGPWGGLEGSLLLWLIVLCGYSTVIAYRYFETQPKLTAASLLVLCCSSLFLFTILGVWSNPLASLLPVNAEGNGLNPLLQHPGMIAHPPLLYLGFVGLNIPFAFALGSLITGQMNNQWVLITRNWTLIAWLFLTLGMIIGGLWAYHVLGWGGYWAWDPVENSSLLPWLAATTFLHSSMAQEKLGRLKFWNLGLVIIAYNLTLSGTFITRSGVLNSVHAFSDSNLGLAFLLFIAFSLSISLGLLLWRLPKVSEKSFTRSKRRLFNRENIFLINNLLFLAIIFTVFYGTIFPLVVEAFSGRRISVQAPFFNEVNFPFLIVLLVLLAIGPLVSWGKVNLTRVIKKISWPLVLAVGVALASYFLLLKDFRFVLLAACIWFSFHLTSIELLGYLYVLVRQYFNRHNKHRVARTDLIDTEQGQQPKKLALKGSRRRFGALLVHMGVVVAILGVVGNFFFKRSKPNSRS